MRTWEGLLEVQAQKRTEMGRAGLGLGDSKDRGGRCPWMEHREGIRRSGAQEQHPQATAGGGLGKF